MHMLLADWLLLYVCSGLFIFEWFLVVIDGLKFVETYILKTYVYYVTTDSDPLHNK